MPSVQFQPLTALYIFLALTLSGNLFYNRAKDPCDCGRSGKPTRAKCCYKVPYGRGSAGGADDGIDGRAVLFRKFHPSLVECDKCPFCSQLVAVSKLQKIANHPCLLQVCSYWCVDVW